MWGNHILANHTVFRMSHGVRRIKGVLKGHHRQLMQAPRTLFIHFCAACFDGGLLVVEKKIFCILLLQPSNPKLSCGASMRNPVSG